MCGEKEETFLVFIRIIPKTVCSASRFLREKCKKYVKTGKISTFFHFFSVFKVFF